VVSFPAWDTENQRRNTKAKGKVQLNAVKCTMKLQPCTSGSFKPRSPLLPGHFTTPVSHSAPHTAVPAQQKSSHTAAGEGQHLHLVPYQATFSLAGL